MPDESMARIPDARIPLAILLFLAAYVVGLNAPFYLDDYSVLKATSLEAIEWRRALSLLTFKLNTAVADTAAGFRVANWVLHLCNTVLVYRIANHCLSSKNAAYLVALVFLLHPINTQSVTYITQRMTALAALFSLLAVSWVLQAMRASARTVRGDCAMNCWSRPDATAFFVMSALLLAVFSKETALAAVPIIVMLLSMHGTLSYKHIAVLAGAAALCFIAAINSPLSAYLNDTQGTINRLDYFLAQGPILWEYLYSIFSLQNLHLEHGLYKNTYSLTISIIAWLAHVLAIATALGYRKKLPAITTGILWFYLGHSIESFLIPITDFKVDHRNYLPLVGLAIAVVAFGRGLLIRARIICVRDASYIAIILVLTIASHNYNKQWANPIAFYQAQVNPHPGNLRARGELMRRQLESDDLVAANHHLNVIIRQLKKQPEARVDKPLLLNAILVFREKDRYDNALILASLLEQKS